MLGAPWRDHRRLQRRLPESDECVVIPEAADPGSSEPAFSPRNRTDAVARVSGG